MSPRPVLLFFGNASCDPVACRRDAVDPEPGRRPVARLSPLGLADPAIPFARYPWPDYTCECPRPVAAIRPHHGLAVAQTSPAPWAAP